jgi:mono/diheme cytochrome c family protein
MARAAHKRQRRAWKWLLPLLIVLAALVAITWRPAIAESTAPHQFPVQQIRHGEQLAAIGSCASCHTPDQARPFAGGLPLATPFGTVYSTNITPDNDTGIGRWPLDAFKRAMRRGISRDGHHLYPAFPYNYYTRLTDADIADLYAFFMTREPVRQPAHENAMRFPFGFRPLLAGWNLLFLDQAPVAGHADKNAQWNRGAYLVRALGHCGACHTPRNALGSPDHRRYLGGGDAGGWYAPALNEHSPSPMPWTVDQLTTYLRTGIAEDHAVAGGPMQEVTTNLANVDEGEVRAIATYIHSFMRPPSQQLQQHAIDGARAATQSSLPAPREQEPQMQLGAQVYASACARCHDQGRQLSSGGALQLPMAIAVYDPDPRSFLHIVRDGITPPPTAPGRWMPGFADTLTDEQLAALAAYLRRYAAGQPAWPDLKDAVEKVKQP